MTEPGNNRGKTGVGFLGEITSLLSHDLKNVLAIINENAGLLNDLSIMAVRGNPLDPERAVLIAGRIQNQVKRADEMIKGFNRVGHSMDKPVDTVSISEAVETICSLSARKAAQKAVSISVTPPSEPVTVKTDPFALQQLIWWFIDMAIHQVESGNSIEVAIISTTKGAKIVFGPMANSRIPADTGPEWPPSHLLEILNADLVADPDRETLSIQLPFEVTA
jgi:light-regulated signal transduction histidine kinase (bacteriophytochrome)